MIQRYVGMIVVADDGESSDVLCLCDRGHVSPPLAEQLRWMTRKKCTVRYWITETECTFEKAQESALRSAMGIGNARYHAHYSEYTGYLYTDEELNVGGHDLLHEFHSYIGKWLYLEVEAP